MRLYLSSLEKAQGIVEYALLLILVSLAVIVALTLLGSGVLSALYNNIIAYL